MSVELKVPPAGESITEVQIGEWLKKEGEQVARDEVIVTIETDKVTVELPAPVAGVISKITVPDGADAQVGDIIGYMEEGGEARAGDGAAKAPTPHAPAAAPAEPPLPVQQPAVPQVSAPPASARTIMDSMPPHGYARVMPSARRVMAERGLSASDVQATGPGGRVLKEDAERASPSAVHAPTAPELVAAAAPAPVIARAPAPVAEPPPDPRGEQTVRMSPMRRRIAARLVESQQTAALLTTFNEIDMSAVIDIRKQYQEQFKGKYDIKLGFMSFFVKAAVEALKLVPQVNAEVRGDRIVYKNYFDIGVAVGGGKGLVVPVIRDAQLLSFAEVEKTILDFALRAKDNRLELSELQGGTFTISNGGIYGSLLSTPIINPPQSGILGLHAIQQRPMAIDGQVVVRPMMYVALTYDHRVVDGREAVTFLKRIKECVEAPNRILLEI